MASIYEILQWNFNTWNGICWKKYIDFICHDFKTIKNWYDVYLSVYGSNFVPVFQVEVHNSSNLDTLADNRCYTDLTCSRKEYLQV
jgi:hypothetical protein